MSFVISAEAPAQQPYPHLDISGFKKWERKDVSVIPDQNYFSALTQLGGYSSTLSGGPLQERLQLRILGQLSKDLSVAYDVEQQPETPERFDVKVKYYENELTFGDLTANFTGNEFASTSKYLNGVMLTAKDGWYDIVTVPSAKLKSQTQNLTAQNGNNTAGPYSLGRGSIVENSESISLNNVKLRRNADYTIDYFEGKITFNRILTQTDQFKYSYEFTNIIDLFFPTLSKRNFFGFQSRFKVDPDQFGKPAPKAEPVIGSGREFFPASGTPEPEIVEEEAAGRYRLSAVPVVRFSEHLTLLGETLRKDEDYLIRYNEGEVKLMTRVLPTAIDPLIIEYKFFQTSWETESLPGVSSRGPYKLAHGHLVAETERVEVDGKLFVRDLDYTIEYAGGEIIFNTAINSTSQINVKYQYNLMALPTASQSAFPKGVVLGTTYLRESAKQGTPTATNTVVEKVSGAALISNNYNLYLQNRPITTTETGAVLIVSVDGQTLSQEADYAIPLTRVDPATGNVLVTPEAVLAYINDRTDNSDGYDTGTIKILNQGLILPTSEVTVAYTYYKSVVGKYAGSGDGTRGPYYLRNVRNIVPGGETVQVWNQGSALISTYTRNSSFEANAGNTGYFINYDTDNPAITFNNELSTSKNFQVIYQYVAPQGFTGGDIAQSVFGVDAGLNIGEAFKVETAYARSETDQVFTAVTSDESLTGNGTKRYNLSSPEDIIENSDKISVNSRLLNKDLDYFINYNSPGQITFYYITPTTQDAIAVTYQFKASPAAGGPASQAVKAGSAYRLGASAKLWGDALSLSGASKKVDYDFTPMGSVFLNPGADYVEYNAVLKPDFHALQLNYAYKQNDNPLTNYQNYFSRSYDNSLAVGLKPAAIGQINCTYRQYNSLDDLTPAVTTHNNDTLQESYALQLAPNQFRRGALTLEQNYNLQKTTSLVDAARDSNNYSQTTIDYLLASGKINLTNRLSAGYDYQASSPTTIALQTSTTEATREAASLRQRTSDTSYNLTLDLTFGPLQKWSALVGIINHEELTTLRNFSATREVVATKNQTYHSDFVPFQVLTSAFDHSRQERTSLVVEGVNPKNERTAANVRFAPLTWFGAGWNGAQSEVIPETGLRNRTAGLSHAYNISYKPISLSHFSLSSDFSLSRNNQQAPSGATPEVTTNTNIFAQTYNLGVTPLPVLPLQLAFTIEDYKNKNDHPVEASRIDTHTLNRTYRVGWSLTPLPPLTLSVNYNQKITQILSDLVLLPQAKTKTLLDSAALYRLFSWGTLNYRRQDENNGGEIQAGAVASLNIEKTTQDLSFNVSVPVDHPVLTSFIFIASVKSVDYKDLVTPTNNFTATRTTFEGTLNF